MYMEWDLVFQVSDVSPSVNRAYYFVKLKNSNRIIKIKTTIAKAWFQKVFDELYQQHNFVEKAILSNKVMFNEGYIEVELLFFFTDARKHDVDNFQKLTLDALTGILWRDDNQIKKVTSEKFEQQPERKTIIKVRWFENGNRCNTSDRNIRTIEEEEKIQEIIRQIEYAEIICQQRD